MSLHKRFHQFASNTKKRFFRKVGLHKPAKIHTSYLVCATPRSGSTLLCEALRNTSVAGRPDEYFAPENVVRLSQMWGVSSGYFERVLEHGTTPNGVFGTKMMISQLDHFAGEVQKSRRNVDPDIPIQELLISVFPNLHYIWITRRDKVRQAVSLEKMLQSGVIYKEMGKPVIPQKQLTFNFDRIDLLYYRSVAQDVAWQEYFTKWGVTPFQVVYEDFVDNYEQTVKDIFDYLKIPIPGRLGTGRRKLEKMADSLSEEWVRRYREIKEAG